MDSIDPNNPVVKLCLDGCAAEMLHSHDEARMHYQQAWEVASDDYEFCIAAHYVARHQSTPEATLHWNRVALEKAEAVGDERIQSFLPSLYLNMGHSFELLGNQREAQHYYDLAAALGFLHQEKAE